MRPRRRIEVRDAREDELDDVAELIVSVFSEFEPSFPPDVWSATVRDWRDVRGRLRASRLIVAVSGSEVVGAVTFFPDAAVSGAERWPSGWASIRAMVVSAAWRRRGIGTRLTAECLRRAREAGRRTVGLYTGPFLVGAMAMYERAGFRRDPAHDVGWLGDGIVPVGTPGSVHALAYRHDASPPPEQRETPDA